MFFNFTSSKFICKHRQEFLREASWLASIRDVNVCRVLAVCTQDGPLCVLQEYSESQELARVVRDNANIR